jgi:XTP/dITP diphosphohydrolase
MDKIVIATGNKGKLREFSQLFSSFHIDVAPQSEFDVPEAIEDGLSFVENALIKARNAAKVSGFPAIADDSGIEVDALHGAPGIYSARYAGEGSADDDNWRKLIDAMQDVPAAERSARFQCLLVYVRHAEDPTPVICQGTWEGAILPAPQGEGGFGYDPVFSVLNSDKSAAQLTGDEKNVLSHRGKALACLLETFKANPGLLK